MNEKAYATRSGDALGGQKTPPDGLLSVTAEKLTSVFCPGSSFRRTHSEHLATSASGPDVRSRHPHLKPAGGRYR
jgi:hypothetical protein